MQKSYFIVVLAHSLHGRLRRIHIPHAVLYGILAFAVFGVVSAAGLAASYARMLLKISNYNDLRSEVANLRSRYDHLRKEADAKNQQLATFQQYASEVSTIFGLKPKMEGPPSIIAEAPLVPTLNESLAELKFLRSANFAMPGSGGALWRRTAFMPNLWPVNGQLLSYFGKRTDPFSGEGALHMGVDISAPSGTPVRATAEGIVLFAGFRGGYGRIVKVDHGANCNTYYAHLSRIEVLPGQRVRRGDTIGYSGASGRASGPHLHYEVRLNGVAVNPYPYLRGAATQLEARRDFNF